MLEIIDNMLAPLRARVALMVARCVLTAVNDAAGLQRAQVRVLADDDHDDVERFQQYGFTGVPQAGAEGLFLAIGGNTDHGVLIGVEDRRYRLKGLQGGEVALYDDQGLKVHLTRDGIVVDGGGQDVQFVNTPTVRIPQDLLVGRDIVAGRDIADSGGGKTMRGMRGTYNGHNHPENNVADGNTNQPNQSM
ncbi:phage baseplate assembly protein V [Ralstonia syzygii subsp. celebesensis]|uniref:phage baseplate assembly protein V n=2 Tax=Ralstonia TaxID=48736 RepID=UPI0009C069A0|nr:phage baseplate assembly protein V [Ralstonia pseudosolanacearum]KAF3461438.1 phage baseplate assembly protein V [Ralstonia solanacearum]MCK4125438.1 phage baseplate assembly protein [Ralstonia pseudosolanacearum]NKA06928.1 phage baseplate assembly protein V [Ralstonia solanacearum]NKA78694.1 phage baseplate assembly protein V [Ralstonia solanacearum]NKG01967.1 phage baseplate assembly protein V [Ralstonia solanacearum]